MKPERKKWFQLVGFVYLLLWMITATLGLIDVDHSFDREFEWAYPKLFSSDPLLGSANDRTKVARVNGVNLRDPYGLYNQANAGSSPSGYWRCRTCGFPIAPFIIIDEAGAQWAPLAGVGGRRLVVWFFGWSHYWWIQHFWLS